MTKTVSDRLSRRNILAGAAVGIAALGAVAVPALNRSWFTRDGRGLASWWRRESHTLANGGLNEWSKQVGSQFRIDGEDGAALLKLVGVEPLMSNGARPRDVGRDRAFVAVFETASAAPVGDRIYPVNHERYGDMQIYFSSTRPAMANGRLEAIFN